MARYFAMHREGGPLHSLDDSLPTRRKSREEKRGRQPKAKIPEKEAEGRPRKNVLRGRESLYRLLAENVTDVIWVSDLQGNLVYISPSVKRQIGYTPDEITSQPMTVPTKRHMRNAIRTALKSITSEDQEQDRRAKSFRLAVTHKDGSIVWTETYMSVLRDRDGQPIGIVGAVRDVTERKMHEQALKRSESQLRLLSQRILQVQEDERARIARDLHDQLGQELVYLRMKAQSLAEQIGESSDAHESVVELVSLIDQTRSTSHRIAVSVSPPILDDMGLVRAVRLCAGDFSRRSSIACFVDVPIDNIGVPKDVATAAYRILQEALTNVWKHAQASEVHVRVAKTRKNLVLRISDNGVGLGNAVSDKSSLGLVGMRERARLAGGSVRVTSRRSGGAQVIARLPLDGNRSAISDGTT
jgi:two-component system, NarL family, sensor histidine kinase UhpB